MQVREGADTTVHILLDYSCSSLFELEPLVPI